MGNALYALLALSSSVLYGAADFIGGMASRRADAMVIVVVSQLAGLILVAAALPLLGTPFPGPDDWLWGTVAGLAGGGGVALLYRALAVGVMSVIAPVTAVCAVAVPVAAAVAVFGERPSLRATGGILVALVAIVLVSHANTTETIGRSRRGLGLALASGLAIGFFYLALARTTPAAGMWPLLFARLTSVLLFGLLVVILRRPTRMPGSVAMTAIAGGVLDMLANLLYLLATREGPLTLVVTLASLYPASTVLLARIMLHERLATSQWVGVGLALTAIVLIVLE
jgi:drug/metabolite transporter (DMT)-like permease